jgi:hypothetical protein
MPVDTIGGLRHVRHVHHAQSSNQAWASHLVLAVAALLAACLPTGGPPSGQHVVHDRTLSGVYVTASEVDGVPSHVLATGPLRQANELCQLQPAGQVSLADVFQFPVLEGHTAVRLEDQEPITKDFLLEGGDIAKYRFATDRRGRLLYLTCSPSLGLAAWRFDWRTASAGYLGRGYVLSPGRTRVYGSTLFELDVGPTLLGSIDGTFVGEDFYYVSLSNIAEFDHTNLGRSKPGTTPEILLSSTGRIGLAAIEGDRPQILVCLYSASPWDSACGSGFVPFALLDSHELTTSVLPLRPVQLAFISASSDGHWLLFTSPDPNVQGGPVSKFDLLLFDWTTGAIEKTGPDLFDGLLPISEGGEWRPGRQELWFNFYEIVTNFGLWKAGSGFRLMAGVPARVTELPDGRISMFTRDGAYWFSWGNALRTAYVGPADDPTAPTFPLHPDGTILEALWEIGDGRLLVGSSTTDPNRQEIAVVDPLARTSRVVASGGHVIALGQGRALVILDWETTRGAGNLTLVDLASGETTLLAENVYAAAVDPGTTADVPPGADRLAVGTGVAFLTRSRLESPYDGLWVARLP